MSATGSATPLAGRGLALAGILLLGVSLRTAVTSVSPIVSQINGGIGFPVAAVAVVGAVPPIVFAVSGFFTPRISRRGGLEPTLVMAILAMVVGHVARALAPNAGVLVVGTAVSVVGVGIANVLIPAAIKRYFPTRVGMLTAVYIGMISISTTVPPLVAVPIADSAGWRVSLGIWALVTVFAAPPWVALVLGARRRTVAEMGLAAADDVLPEIPGRPAPVWRAPSTWAITVIFAVASINVYSFFGWGAELMQGQAHVSQAAAGAMVAVFGISGLPVAVVVPLIAARMRSLLPIILACVAALVVGDLGLILAPRAAPWLFVVILGIGPGMFPLSQYLFGARTRDHHTAVSLSGFVQGLGYGLAVLGPVLVGVFHSVTGGWTAPLIFLLVVDLLAIPAGFLLRRPRMVDDELELAAQ